MNPPGQQGEEKFVAEDLPKIHAALQTARTSKAAAKVTIDIAENGGVIAVRVDTTRKFK